MSVTMIPPNLLLRVFAAWEWTTASMSIAIRYLGANRPKVLRRLKCALLAIAGHIGPVVGACESDETECGYPRNAIPQRVCVIGHSEVIAERGCP
jgi:hypothetical protein